jgi:hypothetical protein
VRGKGLEPLHLAVPEPKGSATEPKPLDLLGTESPQRVTERQGKPEYRHSVQESGNAVERELSKALKAWREGDATGARKALLTALLGLG